MDFFEYLAEFSEEIKHINPDAKKRTIEDYLATFAAHPPLLEEFDTPKCSLEAEHERDRGNKIFLLGRYKEAALLYTNSLKKAPAYSKSAALAYANRSAALYHLKAYEECILDIDRALDLPYPDDLRQKIIARKESAQNILNEMEKNQPNNNNNENEKKKKPIEEDLKYSHGENPRLPEASRGLDIVYNPRNGRKLVAKMPFQIGDILLVEKPYMAVEELEEDPTYCVHCLKKSSSLIPCDRCSEAVYCTEKCRASAYDDYHRIECRILATLTSAVPLDVQGLFCQLRCINILTQQGTNLKQFYDDLKDIEQSTDPATLGFTNDQFIGSTRKGFLSWLSTKEAKYDPGVLFEAGYIVTLLRNYTDFFQTNADVLLVAKHLIKLNAAYELNHFVIPYFGRIDPKAHATFPLIGLASHACVNNTITYIDKDGRMILRASQYIRPGDQISHNYNDLQFSFEETLHRSGRVLQCKRICKKCDRTYVYPPERQPHIKMDKRLRSRMEKDPHDIEGLWKILNIVRGKHQHYTLQAQMIKSMLVEAYEGRADFQTGITQLHMFGIL